MSDERPEGSAGNEPAPLDLETLQQALDQLGLTEERLSTLVRLLEHPERMVGLEQLGDQALQISEHIERALLSRALTTKVEAGVRKGSGDLLRSRLYAKRKSLRSAMRAHENSRRALAHAQTEFARTLGDVDLTRQKVEDYLDENPILRPPTNGQP